MLPTITVDIGTTSVKLCLFDEDAALLTSARHATPTATDADGDAYLVAELRSLVTGFISGIGHQHRARVRRIAITGVGESGGLVRPDLTLASPMILWYDQRGASWLAGLSADERSRIYAVTGLPANANYGLSKVAWAVDRAGSGELGALWLNVSEYVAALMTGERWSEPSLASRTMALDVTARTWSAEVCALVGVGPGVFPALQPAAEGCPLTRSFARETGLDPGVRVHVVGHDHMVGGVGAQLRPGELLNSTGTTEGMLFLREEPRLDRAAEAAKLANGLACTGQDFTLFASIPTGGSAFATLAGMFDVGPDRLRACIDQMHQRYLAGAIDWDRIPLVLPRFRGSPPPDKRASDRGIIAGLRTDTAMEEIVFGCFLGLVLQFRDVLDLFATPPEHVKVIGPATKNPLWLQLKADLLGVPLSIAQFPEVVSRGAQALVSGQSGQWEANETCAVLVDTTRHARLQQWSAEVAPLWQSLRELRS